MRSSDNDGPCKRNALCESDLDVSGSGGHVDDLRVWAQLDKKKKKKKTDTK
jgi:hypothetical protein